ncbi:MAG: GNAT family N-acetyltransferase [Planctomycetes bacterium]|nr:GNAT family N-acetyltransferase [Planctomycetota bacterium]
MADWIISRLNIHHDRSAFDCGKTVLNEWLKERAGQFDRRDLSRTFVATDPGGSIVRGYYAISSHRVVHDALPRTEAKGLPRLDVPVVLIGRLAVDLSVQGKGLGALLLIDALRRALLISNEIGVRAVEVDAIDGDALSFYEKYGFRSLLDDPGHLFLPIHEIRKLGL